MDSAVVTRRPTEQPFESETSALNASEVAEAYGDSRLSESDGRRSAGEMIFDGDNPEERGDQVVGPDFECGGVEVIWLANNELDASSVEKDSDLFFPTVEVGANETATVVETKGQPTDGQGSPDAPPGKSPDFSRLESPASPSPVVDDESVLHERPFIDASVHVAEPAHTTSSDVNVFSEPNVKEQACGKSLWARRMQELEVPVSTAATFGVDQLSQAKPSYTMNNFPLNINFNNGRCSLAGESRPELQHATAPEYVLQPNSVPLPLQPLHPNGIVTTHPSQHHDYGYTHAPISYLAYPVMPNNRGMLPTYLSDGLSINQQFATAQQSFDVNSNILPYQLGQQRRPDDYVCPMNANAVSVSCAFDTSQGSSQNLLRQDLSQLQQPLSGATPSSTQQLPLHSFVNSQPSSTVSSVRHQQYRADLALPNKDNAGATLSTPNVPHTGDRSSTFNAMGFQMPFVPSFSQAMDGGSSIENSNIGPSSSQGDCCPPVLTPSSGPMQEPVNEDSPTNALVASQVSTTCLAEASQDRSCLSLVPTTDLPVIKAVEDVAAFKTPRRLGVSLAKYARNSKKRSQTIDVLVRNSVKNFELSTALSPNAPLFIRRSPTTSTNDNMSRGEKPPVRPYFSIVKYPNMVDVNFRRRPGTKAPTRPRHLCDQTREVIGRVCAYFREFSKRYAALGNTVAGTPFEHPDRMASHATGFALPTIRRCSERVDVVPHCTYRPGSVPTEEELSSLSRTFADEPWYPSLKDKSRAPPPRKKTKKRPTPSPASLSEMENDSEDPPDQQISEADVELNEQENNDDGAPKRRRSQRIMNQRRAKMLNRLRTKKVDERAAAAEPKDECKAAKLVNEKLSADSSDVAGGATEKEAEIAAATKDQQSARVEIRKKRSRRTSSPIPSMDIRSDSEKRSTRVVKRSRSASQTRDPSFTFNPIAPVGPTTASLNSNAAPSAQSRALEELAAQSISVASAVQPDSSS